MTIEFCQLNLFDAMEYKISRTKQKVKEKIQESVQRFKQLSLFALLELEKVLSQLNGLQKLIFEAIYEDTKCTFTALKKSLFKAKQQEAWRKQPPAKAKERVCRGETYFRSPTQQREYGSTSFAQTVYTLSPNAPVDFT